MPDGCAICDRIEVTRRGENPFLIHEFPSSYFVVADHQYFAGYSLILLKRHVRELHELSADEQDALNRELMAATTALVNTFAPWKMNHACLGNQDQHVHWHLMPRYESDPDHRTQPWKRSEAWSGHLITPAAAVEIAARIRGHLAGPS